VLPPRTVAEGDRRDPVFGPRRAGELVPGGAVRLDIQLQPAKLAEGELQKMRLARAHEVLLNRVGQKEEGRVWSRLGLARGFLDMARAFSASPQEWKSTRKRSSPSPSSGSTS